MNYPKINYIGNKIRLTEWIISNFPVKSGIVVDLFAGGASISYALKKAGFVVYSNDCLYSSYIVNKAIVENSSKLLNKNVFNIYIQEEKIQQQYQYISKYLTNILYYDNEVKELSKLIIISQSLKEYDKSLFLSLIRRAMIRKLPYSRMNIKWNQIQKLRNEEYSYSKYGRKRSYHNKTFTSLMLENLENYNKSVFDNQQCNKSFHSDAFDFIEKLKNNVDVIYLDPPYPKTMNKYNDFYELYDIIFNKKINYIDFTNNNTFLDNLINLISKCATKTKYIIISLNNKSSPSVYEIQEKIKKFGDIKIVETNYQYKVTNKINKNQTIEQLLILKTN